ncbi:mitogen-activated protein kinase kinase kinase 5-like isoform X2 [Juglans microcarpa x Juglans regia]|uniref:mitogen-activated protein kinase kinase kinase 5-like isoform X2 n=1 Tax=Juglans microcarpa x Juglans regia TaxID=2249226 RepID=UPI001B7D943B|nr:mitogen-activated protein kinase kinase kinase 5-like isoform X2 [Juglans microcarpa x Juglans regia]
MRWLPSISFSSSSSGSRSSSSSLKSRGGESPSGRIVDVSTGWSFGPVRKLTRQRKLRHLNDQHDISGPPEPLAQHVLSPSNDADFSTPRFSSTAASASSAKPQPLPLPELGIFGRKDRLSSSYVDFQLPSPTTGPSRVVEERDRGGASSNSPIKSVFANEDARDTKKTTGHADKKSSRRESQDLNGSKSSRNGFRVDVPVRSAPTSPFSSPALSPQRRSAADAFPYYYYMVPTGNQAWSAPEMPTSEMIPGLPPPAFFDYSAFSCNTSPHHSPARSHLQNPKSPSGPASPLHSKLSHDTSIARFDTDCPVNVHPLPLPPGAAMPSPSAPIPQAIAKSEFVPMKSQWKKGKLIGRGTFGSVYVATNRLTGALCAMKEVELLPDDPKAADCIKQLQQEIKVLSQLKHLNIVQYYGSEIVEDRFYIYLEYVHPGSINKYVREHCGVMTESVVRNFTRHILNGLAYLHSTKTIHRDIKGANLLVDSFGVVKLADFGMAKHLMQGVMQRDSSSDLALAVDIWSLGCTIIEMLTGKPPWSEFEGAAAMFKILRDTPSIPETLSSEGKDFLRCCFQRNPAERPSAAMLLEHRFMKNSQQLDVSYCNTAFNGKNFTQ